MNLSRWTGIFVAVALCIMAVAIVTPINAAKGGNGKGGGGGGGGKPDPGFTSVIAVFEPTNIAGSTTITGSTKFDLPFMDAFNEYDIDPDDEIAPLGGGHSHFANTGNFTMSLGKSKGKTITRSDETLHLGFLLPPVWIPDSIYPTSVVSNYLFLALNRQYCHDGDPDNDDDPDTCSPPDQWNFSAADGSRPGLQHMKEGDLPVPVSVTIRGETTAGNDFEMQCTEAREQFLGTEFATAKCVEQPDGGVCEKWSVEGLDRKVDPDGTGTGVVYADNKFACGLLAGGLQGYFDMPFKLTLYLDANSNGVADLLDPE